ncbi:major facilitator superfamily domain-containing protein 4A [Trichonephila inaurata madagascariensis]|uniref:Major facilitator superfamily domain-containing protein 4A n=1 Tax=Trichonephila inaurata madagascariensis TaxID=2747483 RepID=A0A8X6YBR5_9ARAC|nr:major facilitator superfamily domain-containing protein 4A [Trichonephila inaurata madagascariensis]
MQPIECETASDEGAKSGSSVDLSSTLKSGFFGSGIMQTKKERYKELFWEHKHTTITLCFVFWSFGTCVAFLGPTLLDLGCKTETIFPTLSWVFFSQSFFILLGSACAGFMLKRFSREIMLIVGTTMMTVSMASIPLCNALWALAIVLAVMGFFMGTIDTVANVSMICIYGKDVSPFLQAIHFFYGVGAFLSPMIAQPFLLNEDCSQFISNETITLIMYDNETLPAASLAEAKAMTHIDYAFLIMALTMVYCGMTALFESDGRSDTDYIPKNMAQIVVVTVLSAILMFLYDGLQAAYGGYIYSYAVKGPVNFRKSDAAYLNALFWGMFAAGRLLSIALATKLSPSFMLFCNIIGCTVGLLLMLALRYNHVMLIIGTCLLGIFMSSVFPTTLSLTEQYIHITPSTTSFLVFGAAVGEMSMPVIVGHEFHRVGPTSLLVIGMVLCFVSIIAYMTLWLVGFTLLKPDSNCFCKRQSNQQQGEVEN